MSRRPGREGGPGPDHGAPWWLVAGLFAIFGAAMFFSGYAVCQLSI